MTDKLLRENLRLETERRRGKPVLAVESVRVLTSIKCPLLECVHGAWTHMHPVQRDIK